jgi:hypothetical protein
MSLRHAAVGAVSPIQHGLYSICDKEDKINRQHKAVLSISLPRCGGSPTAFQGQIFINVAITGTAFILPFRLQHCGTSFASGYI